MAEIHNFDALEVKLQKLCEENDLEYEFLSDGYPIMLRVYPDGEMSGQTSLVDEDEPPMNAEIKFSVVDGDMIMEISDRLTISETLLNKLRGIFKSMHYVYLQIYHRASIEGSYPHR